MKKPGKKRKIIKPDKLRVFDKRFTEKTVPDKRNSIKLKDLKKSEKD